MNGEELFEISNSIASDIIDGIRNNRKELLKMAKELGGDDLAKQMGDALTSLNRSSIFRDRADLLGVVGDLLDASEYYELVYQIENGHMDLQKVTEKFYALVATAILNKVGIAFPFFKLPLVQTAMKKGGMKVGDYVGSQMDKLVEYTATKTGFKAWLLEKYGKTNTETESKKIYINSNPTPAVMYAPKNPPNSSASHTPMVYKPRTPSKAESEKFLLDKSGKISCTIDDFISAAENMRKKQ